MRLTFYANACSVVEEDGFRLLTDPWLTDGAFEGSWFHFPPLRTRPGDLADVDALYVSHLHPDHYDPLTLGQFRRDLPILALDHGRNFLARMLERQGFTNVIRLKDGESIRMGPFRVTMFAPFATHPFHESALGNLLDSAILVEGANGSVLNTNDNTPTVEAAAAFRERHGPPSLALLNYNAAGPYPSCFHNLSDEEKTLAHRRVLDRNLDHMVKVARALGCRTVMPFAGAYVIGGRQWPKNRFLGTTTWDEAADHVRRHAPDLQALVLSEGLTYDLQERRVLGSYQPVDVQAQERYIRDVLAGKRYPHEEDVLDATVEARVRQGLPRARDNLWRQQEALGCRPTLTVYVRLPNELYCFRMDRPGGSFLPLDAPRDEPSLECAMDVRLLHRILDRRAHWNNAEIGCHIDFWRRPDVYLPDAHTLLSFFHEPPAAQAGR